MTIPSETIIAYVDGELSEAERAQIEAALASDEDLRTRIERERALRRRLSAAFDPVLSEPLPAPLVAAAHANPTSNVVSFPSKRRIWSYREWGAMAASLVTGLLLGLAAMGSQSPPLAASANGLVAKGALAEALETKVAANTQGAVRIGVSFRAQDSSYCRTFSVAQNHLAGLACKQGEEWRVPITAQFTESPGEIRTAGADTPASILQAVDQMIAGDPLDAQAEREARDLHWRKR